MKKSLLIKNGNVFLGKNLKENYGIVIRNGKVTMCKSSCAPGASTVINAHNAYILPGLIDFHTHIYYGGTALGIDHSILAVKSGVTTFVDAGSSGLHNFLGFKKFIIEPSLFNVYCCLHVCVGGLINIGYLEGVGELQDERLINVPKTIELVKKHSKQIIAIKIRLDRWATGNKGYELLKVAIRLAWEVHKPLVVHIAGSRPYIERVLPLLRKNDIVAHVFRPEPNSILTRSGKVKKCIWDARKKGIIFDVAHGAGGFSFDIALKSIEQGFYPDIVSSDIHLFNVKTNVIDLPTTMSKLYALGMPLEEVFRAATANPARFIDSKLGTIMDNNNAYITLVKLLDGKFMYYDRNKGVALKKRIVPIGMIVRDKYFKIHYGV